MNERATTLDGCADYDERLLESVFAPIPDAELEAHLAHCSRCRRARDAYLRTSDALNVALAIGPKPLPRARRRWWLAAGIAAAIGAGAFFAMRERSSSFGVETIGTNAKLEMTTPHRAVLANGSARFDVRGFECAVATSLGEVRVRDAVFEVRVDNDQEDRVNAKKTVCVVTVTMIAGSAVWWSSGAPEVNLPAGASLIQTAPAQDTSGAPASSDDAETSAGASERATLSSTSSANAPSVELELRGRVVDEATRAPLGGAEVSMHVPRPDQPALEAIGHSESDGSFAIPFVALDASSTRAATIPAQNGVGFRVARDGYVPRSSDARSRAPIEIPMPDLAHPIELGEIGLTRGVRLSGRVETFDGRAVADAILYLRDADGWYDGILADPPLEIGRTDAAGRMVVPGALPRPAFAGGNVMLFAIGGTGIGWTSVAMLQDRDAVDDVVVRIAPTARIDVFVVDADGRPVEGATVQVHPRGQPLGARTLEAPASVIRIADARLAALFTAQTDAQGRASFERLPVDEFEKRTQAEGRLAREFAVLLAKDGWRTQSRARIYLSVGDQQRVDVVMTQRSHARITGRVVDDAEKPVAGVLVRLTEGAVARPSATSGADGTFEMSDVEIGESSLRVQARADGFAPHDARVDVPPRGFDRPLAVKLVRTAPIEGIAVDDAGNPIEGVFVQLQQGAHTAWMATPKRVTGADGRISIPDATPGAWTCYVSSPSPSTDWETPRQFEVQGGTKDLRIVLRRDRSAYVRLNARVVDVETGAPLDPLAAMLIERRTSPEMNSRPQFPLERATGRITCDRVREGAWTLWVAVADRAPASVEFDANATRGDVELTVKSGKPGAILVELDFGALARESDFTWNAMLDTRLVRPGGREWETNARTYAGDHFANADNFRIDGLVPGRWTVELRGRFVLASGAIDVPPSGAPKLVLNARRGGRLALRGTAAASAGSLHFALTRVGSTSAAEEFSRETDGGAFEIEHLVDPGVWRFELTLRESRRDGRVLASASGEVEVRAGETASATPALMPR